MQLVQPSDLVASLNRRSFRCDAACVDRNCIRSDASRIYARRSRTPSVAISPLLGCTTSTLIQSRTNHESLAARSMNFFSGDTRRFGVSDPWPTAVGSTMLCVRPEVPDGRGGFAPSSDYSMYEFKDGRITAVSKDRTPFGCPNREYHQLEPVPK